MRHIAFDTPANRRRSILLTGATGMVGSLVLADLLRCGLSVAVIVRPHKRQDSGERVERTMRTLEKRFERRFPRPRVLSGDLTQANVGLSTADLSWLTANCSSVIHSAANLIFRPASEHPDNEPYRTNFDGTRRLLNICAAAGIRDWHYVSTAYVAGLREGRVLEEECDVGQQSANDYERSKILAEQLLNQSESVGTLTVYRPSIVIDPHPESVMPADLTINGGFSAYEMQSRRFGVPEYRHGFENLGFTNGDRKNLVAANWVARVITQVYRRPALHGKTFHLTSERGTKLAEIESAFHSVMSSCEGVRKIADPSTAKKAQELTAPFVEAFKPYFRDDPEFDRTNTRDALDASGEGDCPAVGVDEIRELCQRRLERDSRVPVAMASANDGPREFTSAATEFATWCERDDGVSDENLLELHLTGSGGGVFRRATATSSFRAYTSAEHWLSLSCAEDIQQAIDSGALLVEFDDDSFDETHIVGQLATLVTSDVATDPRREPRSAGTAAPEIVPRHGDRNARSDGGRR